MAVSTAVFPAAPTAVCRPRAQQCASAAMSGGFVVPGDAVAPRDDAVAGTGTGTGTGTASAGAAGAVLFRERLRSQHLLTARPVSALPRTAGPVDCPRVRPARGYRMGRWERLGMTLVVAAAVLVVGFVSLGSSSTPTRDTIVLPGDTMLSIALREMPDVDPARAAELIGAANGSTDLRIVPGMTLAIPLGR